MKWFDEARAVVSTSTDPFAGLLEGVGSVAPGWYGKLSMLGDFAQRRLPQHFVQACDTWLSAGMEASRQQLGPGWLDTYLTGPMWRFAFAPGVIDPSWWFGVLMPSVDNVGRYFPLVVARETAAAPEGREAFGELAAWFAHVGWATLNTLRAQASVDDFEHALSGAPRWPDAPASRRPQAQFHTGRERFTLEGAASLTQWMEGMGALAVSQRCHGHSLWWPDHVNTPDDSFSIAPGLPAPEHFALLLEGRW